MDSAYAGRTILEDRPANVHVLSRLRLDAALYAPPPPRRPGQQGRPRRQFDERKWLHDVVISTNIETLHSVFNSAARGENHHRQGRFALTKTLQNGQTIDFRQV